MAKTCYSSSATHAEPGPLGGGSANGDDWVKYNPLTHTYDTPDGTSVAAELLDNVQCLADVLRIAQIRASQRAARAA